ncbi:MAG TPA: hypothetical protein VKA59_28300 [Vicinamibacterales bacterium]|nr:hypothetical protein [Vicinamibacterales bacterium]
MPTRRRNSHSFLRKQVNGDSGCVKGDTLVVDSIGLRDDSWIDWQGSAIDDPKAYTSPSP